MIYFTVSDTDGTYSISSEDYNVSSDRFQWLKRNTKIFSSEWEAQRYILEKILEAETYEEKLATKEGAEHFKSACPEYNAWVEGYVAGYRRRMNEEK